MSATKVFEDFVKCNHGAERKHAYVMRQVVYSAPRQGRCKLVYMTKQKGRQKTEFAIRRGKKIKALRENRSQADFAKDLGLESREAVSQYESGTIKEISLPVVRKFIEMGMDPADLLEDPSILQVPSELPDITPSARKVAYVWDSLPPSLQQFLNDQIQSWQRLEKASPVLATLLAAKADSKSTAKHDRDMEEFTKKFIAEHKQKADKS